MTECLVFSVQLDYAKVRDRASNWCWCHSASNENNKKIQELDSTFDAKLLLPTILYFDSRSYLDPSGPLSIIIRDDVSQSDAKNYMRIIHAMSWAGLWESESFGGCEREKKSPRHIELKKYERCSAARKRKRKRWDEMNHRFVTSRLSIGYRLSLSLSSRLHELEGECGAPLCWAHFPRFGLQSWASEKLQKKMESSVEKIRMEEKRK